MKENGESVVFLPLGKSLFHLQSSFESHNLSPFKKLPAHPDKIFSQQKRPYIKISYQFKLCSSNNRLLFISIRVGFTAHFRLKERNLDPPIPANPHTSHSISFVKVLIGTPRVNGITFSFIFTFFLPSFLPFFPRLLHSLFL